MYIQLRKKSAFVNIHALPDSGTSRTLINYKVLQRGNIPFKTKGIQSISAANSTSLTCLGSVILSLTFEDFTIKVNALVTKNQAEDVLVSYNDLVRLGCLSPQFPSRIHPHSTEHAFSTSTQQEAETCDATDSSIINDLIDEFSDVFDDEKVTPLQHGKPMHISLNRADPNYKALKVSTARKVPLHFQQEADKTLQWYINSGVIEKVPEHETTEWCSPGFFVPKPNGKVRLVVDYRQINKFIDRPVHPFPSPRDIVKDIKPESKWFVKMDASQGYYQVPLDKESKNLTTFLLPSGRYRFTRAPMGMNNSSDYFCSKTDNILSPIPNVLKIVDDALLQAPTRKQVLQKLRTALECCRKHNFTLAKKKLQLGKEIDFAGFNISSTGIKPDPKRMQAIKDFPVPKDISQLRSFLGLANQLGFFVPELAQLTLPLRNLLKKDIQFLWLEEQAKAFQQTKDILTSEHLVKPFDPSLKTELLTDAARLGGLGYALVQRNTDDTLRLIQCGSRSLSSAETRYATNELEGLAILYAISDCHFYLQGAKFTVITDHRPLVGTFNKDLQDIPNARLQRFRERLTHFDFEVIWTPGKTHLIADALSRAPVFAPKEPEAVICNALMAQTLAEDPALQPLYDAIETDHDYQLIISSLLKGTTAKNLPPNHPGKRLSNIWNDLSIFDNTILVWDDKRIIIPKAFRKSILDKLHESHSGVTKTKLLAQQLYFWPGINKEIEQMIGNCEACLTHRDSQHEITQKFVPATKPFQSVSVDLFDYASNTYLVMCDRFSTYIWVKRLKRTATADVTSCLDKWFRELGYPNSIVSDNGPQFRTEFKEYCQRNQIIAVTSSPYNHQSNGLAESAVKTAKKLLKKSDSPTDFKARLQAWRNVPSTTDKLSPSEKFFGRRQRHGLPTLGSTPLPTIPLGCDTKLPPLTIGQTVKIRNMLSDLWDTTGTVTEIAPTGLSYVIQRSEGGKPIRRNRRFLLPFDSTDKESAEVSKKDISISGPRPTRKSKRVSKPPSRYSAG